jgi:2-oxo-4-hydroxy-4-carboxy-5-ureidoimidazoline decarboxylase
MSTTDPATPLTPVTPVTPAGSAGLDGFNGWPAEQARQQLLACCSSARWAAEVASGRPYRTADDLMARSDEAMAQLDEADLGQALAGHPRIGARTTSASSRREQAGVHGADPATIQALADGNAAYERRFGHIYLVCANGRSAAELLALLQDRLGHDPGTEWGVVRGELGKINRIRLRRLLEGGSH